MIRWNLIVAIMLSAVGCGQPAANPPANHKASTKTPAKQSAPKPQPEANFADVAEAISALTQAAAESDSAKLIAAENWLVARSGQASGPVGEIFADEQADIASRIAACRVLRRLESSASKTALIAGMNSSSEQIQLNAIKGLGLIKPTDDEIVGSLAPLLDSEKDRIRREALMALGNVGPPANDAVGAKLVSILNDQAENETLRDLAKKALKEINPRHTFVN